MVDKPKSALRRFRTVPTLGISISVVGLCSLLLYSSSQPKKREPHGVLSTTQGVVLSTSLKNGNTFVSFVKYLGEGAIGAFPDDPIQVPLVDRHELQLCGDVRHQVPL